METIENAYQIQNQLSALYYGQIINILEDVCSSVGPADQYLQLDRVEIDLGWLSLSNWAEAFTVHLRRCLREEISKYVQRLQREPQYVEKAVSPVETMPGMGPQPPAQPLDRLISPNARRLELIQHYLGTGTFPWWAPSVAFDTFEKIVLELLQTDPHKMQRLMEKELVHDKARDRVVHQFSDPLLLRVVDLLVPERRRHICNWIRELRVLFKETSLRSAPPEKTRIFFWDSILTVLSADQHKGAEEDDIFHAIMTSLARKYRIPFQQLVAWLQDRVERLFGSRRMFQSSLPQLIASLPNEIVPENRPNTLEMVHGRKERGLKKNEEPYAKPSDSLPVYGFDEGPVLEDAAPGPQFPENKKNEEPCAKPSVLLPVYGFDESPVLEDAATDLELYIDNAGLVLLGPFLSPFFKHLSLCRDEGFVDDRSAMRAVHLLQYLVTADQETPEYVLPLNKLLCGWDIAKPVSRGIDVSSKEQSESEALLRAVIAHWSALKNTSIEGLRTAFLQRNGVLSREQEHWRLRVERKAYDLLLERLPWTISMIKLSWMKTLIYVEW